MSCGYGGEPTLDLLQQREQLLRTIRDEEQRNAEVVASLRHRIGVAEDTERKHQRSHQAALRACQESDELDRELTVARRELSDAVRLRQSKLETEKMEQQQVEGWSTEIHASWQERQALEASQQMAGAHLKALEAMAASSGAQVNIRSQALLSKEKHLAELENEATRLASRTEAAECGLQRARAQLSGSLAAASSPPSFSAAQLASLAELKSEGDKLRFELSVWQQEIQEEQACAASNGQDVHRAEGRLCSSIAEVRLARDASVRSALRSASRPPFLESEVDQLTAEIASERRLVSEAEDVIASLAVAHRQLCLDSDLRIARLQGEVSEERAITQATGMHLMAEEHALRRNVIAKEARQRQLVSEAQEHDERFNTIFRNLESQIAALRQEEVAAAAAHTVVRATVVASTTGIPGVCGECPTASQSMVCTPPRRQQGPQPEYNDVTAACGVAPNNAHNLRFARAALAGGTGGQDSTNASTTTLAPPAASAETNGAARVPAPEPPAEDRRQRSSSPAPVLSQRSNSTPRMDRVRRADLSSQMADLRRLIHDSLADAESRVGVTPPHTPRTRVRTPSAPASPSRSRWFHPSEPVSNAALHVRAGPPSSVPRAAETMAPTPAGSGEPPSPAADFRCCSSARVTVPAPAAAMVSGKPSRSSSVAATLRLRQPT